MITAIVNKGGGIRGFAEVGAYTALEEAGLTKDLQRAAGTSVGSLVSLMIALRYTAAQMRVIMNSLNLNSLESGFNIFRELSSEGLYSNQHLLAFIQLIIEPKLGINATFADMRTAGFMDFRCVASLPAIQDKIVFSADATPNDRVDLSCLCSACIPGVFPKMQMPGIAYDIVDGGLIENYYITAFDKEHAPSETVGLFVYNPGEVKPIPTGSLPQMALACFESAMAAQDVDDLDNPSIMNRTILIPVDKSSTDFGIVQADKNELFQSGVDAANQFIISKTL